MNSRWDLSVSRCGKKTSRNRYLDSCRSGPDEPRWTCLGLHVHVQGARLQGLLECGLDIPGELIPVGREAAVARELFEDPSCVIGAAEERPIDPLFGRPPQPLARYRQHTAEQRAGDEPGPLHAFAHVHERVREHRGKYERGRDAE